MSEGNTCPKCGSAKLMPVPDSRALMCYACKHEFMPEKPFAPLRIFMSYGHDANEELVRRIYADLKRRGHDVWFDKNDIRPFDNWRSSITDGIVKSQRFFSFLSKHSTRDPGVCLDEIRIALGVPGRDIQSILVESELEVQPPPSISHIQWLDMQYWQAAHGIVKFERDLEGNLIAKGDAAWEQWYQKKLAEIIRVVESDESRKFAGEIRTLENHLKPVVSDFAADARIQKLLEKKITGRAWLFAAVEKWRSAVDRNSRIFWMMGLPGFGKSFFAAHLAHSYGRGMVIGVHFCVYDKPDHRSAPRIVRTLAFQLATRLPDYRKLLLTLPEIAELDRKKTAAELFDYLLANPLKLSIAGGRERLLIVIDALDEAGDNGRNELVEMLARHAASLPDWIGLVLTSRPESDVRAPLQGLNPFILESAADYNRTDVREFLRHELAPQLQPRSDAERLVEQILEKSEGVFLYAEHFCDDLRRGHLSLDHPEQFPHGLGGIFFQYFQRQFPDLEKFRKDVRPALRAILAAREPLPVELLKRLFAWQDEELIDFMRPLGSLFPVSGEPGNHVIKPYHKSLADWLGGKNTAQEYFVDPTAGHRLLATEYCMMVTEGRPGASATSESVISRAAFHLAHSESWRDFRNWVKKYTCELLHAWDEGGLVTEGLLTLETALQSDDFKRFDIGLYASLATQTGRILGRLGDYNKAKNYLTLKALRNCSLIFHRSVISIARHELASLDLYHGRFEAASAGYCKALWFAASVVPMRLDEVAANCIGLSTVKLNRCEFRRAKFFAGSGAFLALVSRDFRHAASAAAIQGLARKALGRTRAARKSFLAGLRYAGSADSGIERSRLLICLGWLNLDLAAIAGAVPGREVVDYFREAAKLARHSSDPFFEVDAQLGCVWTFLSCRDFPAAEYALTLIDHKFHDTMPEYIKMGTTAANGAMAMATGRFSSANECFAKILDQSSRSNSGMLWKSVALIGAGSLAWHSERRSEAESLWNQARATGRAHSPFRARIVEALIRQSAASALQPPQ